jgi:hypothetical protein
MIFRRRNRDLDREIATHLAETERERIASGDAPDAARLAAQREFGSRAFYQEAVRESWRGAGVERVWKDLVYALRQLRRSPGFTASAVLTLALGIGANSAIFSVVDAVLVNPLPYPDAGRLMWGTSRMPRGFTGAAVSPPDFRDYRDRNRSFEHLAAFFVAGATPQSWSRNGPWSRPVSSKRSAIRRSSAAPSRPPTRRRKCRGAWSSATACGGRCSAAIPARPDSPRASTAIP